MLQKDLDADVVSDLETFFKKSITASSMAQGLDDFTQN